MDGNGNISKRFIYASRTNVPDIVVDFSETPAGTYRIISDHLGSPRRVINTVSGEIRLGLEYDEWGNEEVTASVLNRGLIPFGFAGGLYDEGTGLVRFGTRDYDPELGRWTSKDPIRFAGSSFNIFGIAVKAGNPMTETNLYGYALLDPINLVDSLGLFSFSDFSNFSAGFGDSLLLGFGDDLRNYLGIEGVDVCSDAYTAGATTGIVVGFARLAYAGFAKVGSAFAATGAAALTLRNSAKVAFRFGLFRNWRSLSYSEALRKYGTDAAVKAAAGRTNTNFNTYGAGVGISGAFGSCGCP